MNKLAGPICKGVLFSPDEEPAPLALPIFPSLLQFCGLMLALFLYGSQSLLPSRLELEVAETLAGRGGARPAFQPDDYVEWEVSPCYGYCPTYRVRLDRQGDVEYQGLFHTCKTGVHRRQIDIRQAEAVLAAADIALRGAVQEELVIDASSAAVTARVAGRTRQLDVSLSLTASQVQVTRFLRDGAKIVLDPGWLPVWSLTEAAYCVGTAGERIPYDPRLADSQP